MIKTREMMIKEIVDRLIGHTDVWCDSRYDEESFQNMEELEQLLYHLLDKVIDNYKYRTRHEASAQSLAKQAESILKEVKCIVGDIDED